MICKIEYKGTVEFLGKRFKFAREAMGLTQQEAADRLGIKDRQTLAAIETGLKKPSAEELVKACVAFEEDLEFFVDPLRLVNEGAFTWRIRDSSVLARELPALKTRMGNCLALYRVLREEDGGQKGWLEPRLALEGQGSLEEIEKAAQALRAEWHLEPTRTTALEWAIKNHVKSLIWAVEAPVVIKSGVCRLPRYSVIFVNRSLTSQEWAEELAHQVFHLLTWEQLPPLEHVIEGESVRGKGISKHIERLADHFAQHLLLPEEALRAYWEKQLPKDNSLAIVKAAEHFGVALQTLYERLKQLELVSETETLAITPNISSSSTTAVSPYPLFDGSFIKLLSQGLSAGRISARRAASILGMRLEELAELLRAYHFSPPFEL